VFPTLGNLTLSQINRRQHVEPWVTDLSAHLAPSTVRRIVQLLSRAMEAAMDEVLILRNPTRGVELPPEKHKDADHLTVDEIHAVAAAIDARFRAMFDLANPFVAKRRTIEKRAKSFDEACRLKTDGEAAERKRRSEPSERFIEAAEKLVRLLTVSRWIDTVEDGKRRRSEQSVKRDRSLIDRHILPVWADVPLVQVEWSAVEKWVSGLVKKGLAPTTIRKIFGLFSGAMEKAVDRRVIDRNPCRGVELPQKRDTEVEHLEPAEVRAIAESITDRFRCMVLLGGFTGMRIGEVAGLTVPKLNLEAGTVNVDYTLTREGDLKEPKTKTSRRCLALPDFLVQELLVHLAKFSPGPDGLVFTMPEGGPIHFRNFDRRHWQPACLKAIGRKVRFHTLRHSHTVMLQAAQVDPKLIMSRLGHSNLGTTYNVYAHSSAALDKVVATAVDYLIRSTS